MKNLFIIANWKSNKTVSEAAKWFEEIQNAEILKPIQQVQGKQVEDKKIIICPPFTLLSLVKERIKDQRGIKIGAQDVSPFEGGAYTGEISAGQIKEFADYVIIGHSERRKYFNEDEEMIEKKLEMAVKNELIPILCISEINQIEKLKNKWKLAPFDLAQGKIGNWKIIIAYEPLFAIGSGQPDTPENADSIASTIKKELGEIPVLYGGSVTSKNVGSFTQMPSIDGILVGSASLDPLEFLEIIKNA